MRISAAQRIQNENRIRAAMDRLLRGEIPPGGNCDIKTLAREAGVDRTAFYGNRPYAHLRDRIRAPPPAAATGRETPDPKTAQIERLKSRGRQAQNQPGPGEFDNRATHRLPDPSPGPARRPTRRDPSAPLGRRPEGEHRPPPGDAEPESHRPMLTQHRQ